MNTGQLITPVSVHKPQGRGTTQNLLPACRDTADARKPFQWPGAAGFCGEFARKELD